MTDIELGCSPEDARRVVMVALDETPAVRAYTVEGGVITARTAGGVTSFGELVFVELPEPQVDSDRTLVSVTADRRYGFNVTANPWKSKSEVIEGLRRVDGTDAGTLPPGGEKQVTGDAAGQPEEPATDPDLMLTVARVLAVMLLGLVLLGGLFVGFLVLI